MAVYYNLTTFIPEAAGVAIPRKAKVSTMPDRLQLKVHYYTNERHELGITRVKEGKNRFQIYDIENSIMSEHEYLSVRECKTKS